MADRCGGTAVSPARPQERSPTAGRDSRGDGDGQEYARESPAGGEPLRDELSTNVYGRRGGDRIKSGEPPGGVARDRAPPCDGRRAAGAGAAGCADRRDVERADCGEGDAGGHAGPRWGSAAASSSGGPDIS